MKLFSIYKGRLSHTLQIVFGLFPRIESCIRGVQMEKKIFEKKEFQCAIQAPGDTLYLDFSNFALLDKIISEI